MFGFDHAIVSSCGGRPENQDYAECANLSDRVLVCALADGLGGHRGGSIASRLAVTTVFQTIRQDFRFSAEGLTALQRKAHEAIVAEQRRPGLEAMRSTLVVLVICEAQALWLHCGDSRLYHFRDGRIIARTHDHSVPGLFVAAQEISFDEIRHHPDRNKLLRALGGGANETTGSVLKQPVNIEPNDRFLVSSDGFWETVLEQEMLDLWGGDVDGWLRNMEALIVRRAEAEHDNYTACAIQVRQDRLAR
jgi:serine/threonine protein phosphatase PrpC